MKHSKMSATEETDFKYESLADYFKKAGVEMTTIEIPKNTYGIDINVEFNNVAVYYSADFTKKVIEGDFHISGRFILGIIAGPLIRIAISRDFWKTYKLAKKI